MTDRNLRLAMLHGVFVMLAGMLVAGVPLVTIVMRDVYGQTAMILPGDYRAWMMAHLEGLLNGLILVALAMASRQAVLTSRRSRLLLWALAAMGYGNVGASVLAPILGVRGMAFDGGLANDLVTGTFGIAFVGTVTAFWIIVAELMREGSRARFGRSNRHIDEDAHVH